MGDTLLVAALGVVGTSLVRTYSYGTGWFAYAAADLSLAFCVGLVARQLLRQSIGEEWAVSVAPRALALLAIAMLAGISFFLYPELVFSESAVLQTGRALLQPARMFPLWLFAGTLGLLLPARASADSPPFRWGGTPLAAGLGAAAALRVPASPPSSCDCTLAALLWPPGPAGWR